MSQGEGWGHEEKGKREQREAEKELFKGIGFVCIWNLFFKRTWRLR